MFVPGGSFIMNEQTNNRPKLPPGQYYADEAPGYTGPKGGAPLTASTNSNAFQQDSDYRQQAAKSAMLAGSRAEDAYNAYGKQMRDYRQSAAQGLLAQQRGIGQQFGNAAIAAGRGGGGAYAGNIMAGGQAAMQQAQLGESQAQKLANMQQQFGAMGVEAAEMQGLAATKAMEMGNINQDRQVKTANYEKNIASMVENFSKGRNRPEDFIRAMDWRIQLEQDPVMRQWLEKRKREGLQQMASWF